MQRTYIGIDIRKTLLETEGTQRAEILHRGLSKERERGEQRKRGRAEICVTGL